MRKAVYPISYDKRSPRSLEITALTQPLILFGVFRLQTAMLIFPASSLWFVSRGSPGENTHGDIGKDSCLICVMDAALSDPGKEGKSGL